MVSFCEYRNGDILFRNWLFMEKIRNGVKIIDVLALIEDEEKFSKVNGDDAIRLCLLLSLEIVAGPKYQNWCLDEKIHVVLKETGVFEKENIDLAKYKNSFRHDYHVPKQGGVFGDYGVFLLAYCVPLAVEDPVQAALAYREKMIHFYFQHKMFCP
uniref:Phospholipase-like protein n=1 Tax=Tanacetum cinerariifolium TaxID=118510 RepID=A0A699HN09_TANCI|nr:phospholipase-like protein [Tanacetum cinerariifolium]